MRHGECFISQGGFLTAPWLADRRETAAAVRRLVPMPSSTPSGKSPNTSENTGPLARFGAAPGLVRLLALLVALQGTALVLLGLFQTVEGLFAVRVMPLGAVLLLALLYIGYGLWLVGAAAALLRGRLWPRALVVVTQAFLVLISVQSSGLWGWPVTILLVLYGVAVAVLLFSRTTSAHLAPERFPERDGR